MMGPLGAITSPTPALYTIPAGRPFLKDLIRPLMDFYAEDPVAIADLTLFLPNRRAVRSVSKIFYDIALEKKMSPDAVFLPRLRALGDVDEEDLLFTGGAPPDIFDLNPAADPQDRRFILAHLVAKKRAQEGKGVYWPSILQAADELASLLDSFHLEDVPLTSLENLVPPDVVENAAEHWQQSLEFLSIITTYWPDIMAEKGWMEPAARQQALIRGLTQIIVDEAKSRPVIVAGSLGTVRATGELMAAVARSPMGAVVLPGLDKDLDEKAWTEIDPPHPQALFRERLRRDFKGLSRQEITLWPHTDENSSKEGNARRAFLSLALRPAKATDDWYARFQDFCATERITAATKGFHLIAADTEEEEASLVALRIREALEVPEKTIMLVSPDRQLCRRVTEKLLGWQIEVDDTGGVPVGGTYRGTFLRNAAQWLSDPLNPGLLLTLLKHDLCQLGLAKDVMSANISEIDKALRGPQYWTDTEGLFDRLSPQISEDAMKVITTLFSWGEEFWSSLDLRDKIFAHISLCERLADNTQMTGAERLWRYEDGEQLALILNGILKSDVLPEDNNTSVYAKLFEALLGQGVVRQRGGHPRVSVYGLLEARLQSADLILLAGLNEGVWPNAASTDSFLSRPMRETLGLPSPEHLIGRAAHDFAQCAAAPEVVLSWSARKGRSPSAPSRWVVRLNSFLHKADCYQKVDETARLRALARHQTQPNQIISVKPPLPKPPLEARPRRLSLSDIGVLTRDPYAIYAKHVLGLFPMDRVAAPLGPREKGTYVHSIFEQFARKFPDTLPQDILEQARQTADQVFLDERYPKEYAIFWMSDIDRVLNFLKTYEEKVRAEGRPLLLEGSGQWTFDMKGAPFTLRARVDRIDLCQDGSVSIVDFKTGDRQATMKQDKSFNPQLSLTALMVKVGAFEDLGPMTASRIAYLVVSDEDPSKGVFKANRSLEDPDLKPYLQEVEGHFLSHLAGYFDRDRGYPSQPRPFLQNEYGDYDHLARRGEWGQGGDDQGEAS